MKKTILDISIVLLIVLNLIIDFNINKYISVINDCFKKNISLSAIYYTFICFIIALISILILVALKLIMFDKKTEIKGVNLKSEDGTYGTANWLSDEELNRILGKNEVPGIIQKINRSNRC